MASLWGDIFGGGTALAGYSKLMDDVGQQRQDMSSAVGGMQTDVTANTQFQPWSVRSGLGATSYDNGQTQMNLSGQQNQYAQQQGMGAANMFGRAMQDPAQREGDIYNRIRAMQEPGEQRQYDSMNANLFGSGRGGMQSDAYGGSPEQQAFGMAQSGARNQAAYQAMNQAQQEMQNYAGIGQQMFGNQYMPWQQQMAQSGVGQNNSELAQRGQLEGQNLWAQLGLGGLTADTNYANIQGNAFGNAVQGVQGAAQGIGDQYGGLISDTISGGWDWLKNTMTPPPGNPGSGRFGNYS